MYCVDYCYSVFLLLCVSILPIFSFFFFNDTATTEIYTLSLHDALPISQDNGTLAEVGASWLFVRYLMDQYGGALAGGLVQRSEEHTSELQSRLHLVCRLLL